MGFTPPLSVFDAKFPWDASKKQRGGMEFKMDAAKERGYASDTARAASSLEWGGCAQRGDASEMGWGVAAEPGFAADFSGSGGDAAAGVSR